LAYHKKVFDLRAGALCLTIVWRLLAQNPPAPQVQEQPPAERSADQYFSGTVISYAGEKVTVARTAPSANGSSRDFMITRDTEIEGKLKVKVRVTVQYIVKDDVDYAVHIIVRNQPPKK
jgi:hypothetical protein